MGNRWTGVALALGLLAAPLAQAQDDAGDDAGLPSDATVIEDVPGNDTREPDAAEPEDAAEGLDTAEPDTSAPDTWAPDTAALPDASEPDTAALPDRWEPDSADPQDAAERPDTAEPQDAAEPDTAEPDAGCQVYCIDESTLQQCSPAGDPYELTCDSGEICEDGMCISTSRPDAARTDFGTCVPTCIDESTLQSCSADGRPVELNCPEGYECDGARCAEIASEPPPGGGCNCAASPAAPVAAVLGLGCLLVFRRRRVV